MEEFKKHLIVEYNKEKHNWMVEEIKAEFNCDECDLVFPRKSSLESHNDKLHGGDRGMEFRCVFADTCNNTYSTKREMYNHTEKDHKVGEPSQEIIEIEETTYDEDNDSFREIDFNDFYKMDTNPKEVVSKDRIVGFTFTGESDEYKHAKEKIEVMMTKPKAKYTVGGREIEVKSVPKAKGSIITLEVTGLNGKVGLVALKCYSTRNKNTLMLTKMKGYDVKFVNVAAQSIFQPLLKGFISGELDQSKVNDMKEKPHERTIKKPDMLHDCLECDKTYKSIRGLQEHKVSKHEFHCDQCDSVLKTSELVNSHKESEHKKVSNLESSSPEPKKHKFEVEEEETLKKMNSLTVSETEINQTAEKDEQDEDNNMDFIEGEVHKKRKREESVKQMTKKK